MSMIRKLQHLLIFNIAICFSYYFMEWLFFITKSSPLVMTSFIDQVAIYLISPLPLLVVSLAISALLLFVSMVPGLAKFEQLGIVGIPSAVLATAAFMLIENFTYTLFGFHSGTFKNIFRFVYLAGLLFLSYRIYLKLSTIRSTAFFKDHTSKICGAALTLVVLSVAVLGVKNQFSLEKKQEAIVTKNLKKPNIIIFSTDGLRTESMSSYGYERKTTPYIDSMLSEFLVFENQYANSANTPGSVVSLLSGKLPTTTRVIFRPDILKGVDVYEHLPGILKKLGYYNGDFSVRHYADAYDLNMREAFDVANERYLEINSAIKLPPKYQQSFGLTAVFLQDTFQRIASRLKHVTGIEDYSNPFAEVTALNHTSRGKDERRLEKLKEFIKDSPRPFFASVHMLNTHGRKFYFRNPHFSIGAENVIPWHIDSYDDAILNYDIYVKEVISLLKSEGILDNTIFIINSDHGMRWNTTQAIPLIIRFPNSEYAGRVAEHSQRIDIAPTLLDYMGVEAPSWMEGVSLIDQATRPPRKIFVSNRTSSKSVNGWRQVVNPSAPFYTLGTLALIYCNQWFRLNVRKNKFKYLDLKTQSIGCKSSDAITKEQALDLLFEHLNSRGYDISSLTDSSL